MADTGAKTQQQNQEQRNNRSGEELNLVTLAAPHRPEQEKDQNDKNATGQEPTTLRFPSSKRRKITPVLAIIFLVVSFLCIASSIAIVYFSNDRAVNDWISRGLAVNPSVLLAVTNSVLAFSTKQVFIAGVAIKWWRTYYSGTDLTNLHYIANQGKANGWHDMFQPFKSSQARHVMTVFVAITLMDLSDGPLLQRSLKSVITRRVRPYESDMALVQNITDGWAGTVDNASPARIFASGDLAGVVDNWYNNVTESWSSECVGSCEGVLVGAGVAFNCSAGAPTKIELLSPQNFNATLFSISFSRAVDGMGAPVVEMTHEFTHNVTASCEATVERHYCSIRAATVDYDAIILSDSIRLHPNREPSPSSVYKSAGDLPASDDTPIGPLSALDYFGYYYLRSVSTLSSGTGDEEVGMETVTGMLGAVFSEASESGNSSCSFQWLNATDSIIHDIHDVMFRIAVYSSTGDENGDTKTWTDAYDELAYRADLLFLWLAVAIMFSGTFAATSLLWGYWRLDRQATLSPLETGCALADVLKAPPPRYQESKMAIENLLEDIGGRKVEKLD
ncbi:hypothetical protein HBI88_076650 [Parastagonospora nodorum]|nr:hypothetical protein HBI97_029260 [Parastagonospora nodorum]KAH5816189.1 hypothetical protein HBI96_066530 [Parastagonospora nodorum]KAH5829426.1 hypothetical protein HBI94_050980 [Parastagonospora nodorum]KAH5837361.1 hypothetical protein HBI93_084300 [Parastagonospora nodorum]KAH5863144.1 hypothetical protein HBI91_118300 [Parastagonospora nodorum]